MLPLEVADGPRNEFEMKHLAIASLTIAMTATTACSNWEPSGDANADTGLISAGPPLAQGTVDGGGGNSVLLSSSALEVKSVIDRIKELSKSPASFNVYSIGDDWKFAREKKYQVLLRDVSEKASQLLHSLVLNDKVVLQTDACTDPHSSVPRDGSAQVVGKNGTICLSTSRLQRIPPGELKNQILALLLHEVVHLLGYGEHFAQYAQDYYLRDIAGSLDVIGLINCSQWHQSPYSARCMLGNRPSLNPQYAVSPDPQLAKLESIKTFLDQKGISCNSPDGKPLTWEELIKRIADPDSRTKFGFTDLPLSEYRTREYMELINRLMRDSLAYGHHFEIPKQSVLEESFFPKFKIGWADRAIKIDQILAETAAKWAAFYPNSTYEERRFSACQIDSFRERVTFFRKLELERDSSIQTVLEFE